ncbi:MAG: glycosyl transferase family 1, partial [Planctomycetota bacterium]
MKVVFLSPVGQIGGAERVLLTLLDAWQASGQRIEPGVLALSDGPLLADLRNRKVRCAVEPMPDRLAKLGDSGGG